MKLRLKGGKELVEDCVEEGFFWTVAAALAIGQGPGQGKNVVSFRNCP